MKRMVCVLLCLLLTPIFAYAQSISHVYGGSGFDSLGGVAVSSNGHILLTGYTDSSDGTLENRTKNGPAGWVLCIDQNGEVLWHFCRHTAKYERMEAPAVQNGRQRNGGVPDGAKRHRSIGAALPFAGGTASFRHTAD